MRRTPPKVLDTTGATDGDALTYDQATDRYRPGAAVSSLGAVPDVDTTTTPPTTGDALVWDGSAWVPGATTPATALVPLTTTVGGVPQLVWDENDNLVMTEVPL